MTTILIGSTAASLLIPGFREPKDTDVFTNIEWGRTIDTYWHPAFAEYFEVHENRIATLDELYTIKISHSGWDLGHGSWEKHQSDAMNFKTHGAGLVPELYSVLVRAWKDKHGTKRVDLDQDSGGDREEVWLPYPGSSKYSISNLGRVRGPRGIAEGTKATTGYRQYYVDGSRRLGHSLVMETFVGPLPAGMQVRHLDGNPQNNMVSNLMYGTPKQNGEDKSRHGMSVSGEKHPLSKLTESDVLDIRSTYAKGGITQRELAGQYDVAQSLIGRVINHQSWSGDGFFDDAVKRVYVHDSIHKSCAITPGQPLYERFLKPGKSVDMDMEAVWRAGKDVQLNLFSEEIAATALERWVIPSNYRISPGLAWHRAAKKTIVSLTKGRSSRFCAENYDTLCRATYDYVQVHKSNAHLLEEING